MHSKHENLRFFPGNGRFSPKYVGIKFIKFSEKVDLPQDLFILVEFLLDFEKYIKDFGYYYLTYENEKKSEIFNLE